MVPFGQYSSNNRGGVMTNRSKLWSAGLLVLVAAACGPGEVVVDIELEMLDPETGERAPRTIEDVRVQLLPFDRDFIFDSLAEAADRPEPQFPRELVARRDSLRLFQEQWRDAEAEWLALREQLGQIAGEMEDYNPAEARYRELFAQFDQVEGRYVSAERRKDDAFARFDRLQQEAFAEMEQARAQLESWEDEAYADYGNIVAERLRESRLEILADTTDSSGRAHFRPRPGEWWVYARYQLPTVELYWNLPVQVERGEPVEVRLREENAQERDVF
jgi:hypothetical protein